MIVLKVIAIWPEFCLVTELIPSGWFRYQRGYPVHLETDLDEVFGHKATSLFPDLTSHCSTWKVQPNKSLT